MINSFQHIGMGVFNVEETHKFYKKIFGFNVKLNDLVVTPKEMSPVIGSLETMHMLMSLNLKGGALLEFIEHKSSSIRPLPQKKGYGDYGILEVGFNVQGIDEVVKKMQMQEVKFLIPICQIELQNGHYWKYTYLRDPNGVLIQLIEDISPNVKNVKKPAIKGVMHIGVGVSDIDKSENFYKKTLGFDRLLYSHKGIISDMEPVIGKSTNVNMSIWERSAPVTGLATVLPAGIVKLIHVPNYNGQHIYKERRWGDIGCMEFCMDVSNLRSFVSKLEAKGIKIFLNPVTIDMGSGSKGLVAYIRDPDGTVIEFVEIETVAWMSASLFIKIIMPLLKIYNKIVK